MKPHFSIGCFCKASAFNWISSEVEWNGAYEELAALLAKVNEIAHFINKNREFKVFNDGKKIYLTRILVMIFFSSCVFAVVASSQMFD